MSLKSGLFITLFQCTHLGNIWILRKLIKINLFRLILTSSVASPETKYNIQQFRKHVLNEFL